MFDAVSIFQNKVNLCSIKFCIIAVPGLISQEVHCSTHFFTIVFTPLLDSSAVKGRQRPTTLMLIFSGCKLK